MPRPSKPLTDTQIRRAKPPKLLVDGKGLALRIKETSAGIVSRQMIWDHSPQKLKETFAV
jgi:hypothetical protein